MPPAARALPPSGLLSGESFPRPPQRLRIPHRLAPARDTAVLWASDILFQDAATEPPGNCFSKKGVSECPTHNPPHLQKVLGGRGMGVRGGGGSPSPEGFPPLPRISKCYLHHGALPLSQRELSACASRKVSMHCQKPVWRYMESWPSAARRSSGSFSRSQDSSSER